MDGSAVFSPDRCYRYRLTRTWDETLPRATWVLLNPSTADARNDDPTIRRCVGFSRRWGHGSIEVVNLFAYRSVSPRELLQADDPIGPDNPETLADVGQGLLVAGWGAAHTPAKPIEALAGKELRCLGVTTAGHPRHPLYVPYETALRTWDALRV